MSARRRVHMRQPQLVHLARPSVHCSAQSRKLERKQWGTAPIPRSRTILAVTAAEAGRRVYYETLAGLIESVMEARAAGEFSRRLRVLTHPALLVVDEIGYPPISQDGAVLFFQLINARHERASTVLTSNRPLAF